MKEIKLIFILEYTKKSKMRVRLKVVALLIKSLPVMNPFVLLKKKKWHPKKKNYKGKHACVEFNYSYELKKKGKKERK